MIKYSIADLSIVISLKIDSKDRINNLIYLLHFYDSYFKDLEIVIIEQGIKPKLYRNLKNIEPDNEIILQFIEDGGPHYKTRNLNLATSMAQRQIVMQCDCDVFIPPQVLLKAVRQMKKHKGIVLSPHNGIMVEIPKKYLKLNSLKGVINTLHFFPRSFDRELHMFDFSRMNPIYGNKKNFSTGGCILYRKIEFFLIGGWNSNIISYGYEDMEFIYRAKKLGMKHSFFKINNIYHLQHYRGKDSVHNNFYRCNELEWNVVTSMDENELRLYGLNGFRRIKLGHKNKYSVINTIRKFSIEAITSDKINLSNASIIVLLESIPRSEVLHVNKFTAYLEKCFKNYEVYLVEYRSRYCVHLNNKLGVKYMWCANENFAGYEKFIKEVLGSIKNNTIGVWDYISFIDPERVRTGFEVFLKKKMELLSIEDELWKPKNAWRKEEKGDGLTMMLKSKLPLLIKLRRLSS